MSTNKRHQVTPAGGPEILGLTFDAEKSSFTFSIRSLPATEHLFFATDFQAGIYDGQLHIIFGNRSSLDKSPKYRLALEIVMPVRAASRCLYEAVWTQPSLNRDIPYIESIRSELASNPDCYSKPPPLAENREYELPSDANSFRMLGANFATSTCSQGQVMVEFLEAPPDLIVSLLHHALSRSNSQVRSIVGVIMSPVVAVRFYEEMKILLSPFREKEEA